MKKRHVLVYVSPANHARLAGIGRCAREEGWQLTIIDRLARQPRGWKGDGALVTLRDNPATVALVKSLNRSAIPVVDMSRNKPEVKVPRVSGDHFEMGRLAREHLNERNYRNLAWYSTCFLNVHRLRYEGFAQGDNIARWVLSEAVDSDRIDDFTVYEKWIAAKVKKAPKPLGLLAYDDADAARVVGACLAQDINVPGDVAVIGIGGDRIVCENQQIPITSVEHDQGRTGYEAAKLLARLMDGEKPPKQPILIPPRGITVRASTDAIAAKSRIVRDALDYIRSHLDQPFGLTQVAEYLNVPRNTLSKMFSEEIGRTLGDETMRERIELAKRLIAQDSMTMAEIAYKTGFCNPGYFSNAFKARTGVTPKNFK